MFFTWPDWRMSILNISCCLGGAGLRFEGARLSGQTFEQKMAMERQARARKLQKTGEQHACAYAD